MTAVQIAMLLLFVAGYSAHIRLLILLGQREDMKRDARFTGKFLLFCVGVSIAGIMADGLLAGNGWLSALLVWGVLNLIAIPLSTAIAYLYTMPRRRARGWIEDSPAVLDRRPAKTYRR